MARTSDTGAYAANWRTVLAVDGGIGLATSLAGVVVALVLSAVVGLLVIALGAAYAGLVGARARRWTRLRREAGL